jgi:hypothetical protein
LSNEASDDEALSPHTSRGTRLDPVAFLGTPLFDEPDESSRRLAFLNKGAVLRVTGSEGDFLKVVTEEGASGYLRDSSAVALSPHGIRGAIASH